MSPQRQLRLYTGILGFVAMLFGGASLIGQVTFLDFRPDYLDLPVTEEQIELPSYGEQPIAFLEAVFAMSPNLFAPFLALGVTLVIVPERYILARWSLFLLSSGILAAALIMLILSAYIRMYADEPHERQMFLQLFRLSFAIDVFMLQAITFGSGAAAYAGRTVPRLLSILGMVGAIILIFIQLWALSQPKFAAFVLAPTLQGVLVMTMCAYLWISAYREPNYETL